MYDRLQTKKSSPYQNCFTFFYSENTDSKISRFYYFIVGFQINIISISVTNLKFIIQPISCDFRNHKNQHLETGNDAKGPLN